jgi:hypothetical protein
VVLFVSLSLSLTCWQVLYHFSHTPAFFALFVLHIGSQASLSPWPCHPCLPSNWDCRYVPPCLLPCVRNRVLLTSAQTSIQPQSSYLYLPSSWDCRCIPPHPTLVSINKFLQLCVCTCVCSRAILLFIFGGIWTLFL